MNEWVDSKIRPTFLYLVAAGKDWSCQGGGGRDCLTGAAAAKYPTVEIMHTSSVLWIESHFIYWMNYELIKPIVVITLRIWTIGICIFECYNTVHCNCNWDYISYMLQEGWMTSARFYFEDSWNKWLRFEYNDWWLFLYAFCLVN